MIKVTCIIVMHLTNDIVALMMMMNYADQGKDLGTNIRIIDCLECPGTYSGGNSLWVRSPYSQLRLEAATIK